MIEKKHYAKIPFIGITLVVLGVGLLLHQMNILRISNTTLIFYCITSYGIAMIVRSFFMNIRQSLFFGSLCFYSGVLLLLGNYEIIETSPYIFVPGFLMAFGLSFLMLFVFDPQDFHLLVPAGIFIGLGIVFMMTEIGYLYPSDVKDAISMYWPAVLILFGILMLFRRKVQ